MESATRSTVFRVTGLPIDKAELDVKSRLFQTIHDLLTEDERQHIMVHITCIPSCDSDQTLSALVEFKGGNAKFLSELDSDPLGEWQVEMGDEDINFDRHFFGFTQLYPTAPSQPVTAEYGLLLTCDPDANLLQRYRDYGPGRTRVWVVAREGQPRANVAPRLPLKGSAELSHDDLWL